MSYECLPDQLDVVPDAGGRVTVYAPGGTIRLEVVDEESGGDAFLDFDRKTARDVHKELSETLLGGPSSFRVEVGEREAVYAHSDGERVGLTCFVCDDGEDETEAYSVRLSEAEALRLLAQMTTVMIRERIDFG